MFWVTSIWCDLVYIIYFTASVMWDYMLLITYKKPYFVLLGLIFPAIECGIAVGDGLSGSNLMWSTNYIHRILFKRL